MKKIIFIIQSFFFLITYSQWYPLPTTVGPSIVDMDFVNPYTGFAVGYYKLIRTTNSGETWINDSSFNQYHLRKVYFKNENTGFTFSFDTIHASLFRTTNNGVSWHNLNVPDFRDARSILFLNDQTGFVFGKRVIILKTTNGGNNWFHAYPSYTLDLCYINGSSRVNDSTFVGAGTFKLNAQSLSSRAIYYSNNAGQTVSVTVIWENYTMDDVAFNNSGTGILGGANYFGRSTDGGISWVRDYTPEGYAYDVCFSNEFTAYKVNGSIKVSTDAGLNWITQYPSGVRLVDMIDANIGYALAMNGVILKTTNGGFTGIKQINKLIPEDFKLSQNYPNPFNPSTKIRFALPPSPQGEGLGVRVIIYDILGREIETLVNEQLQPGTYEVEWDAENYPSGVYYCKLQSGNYSETKKMILMK